MIPNFNQDDLYKNASRRLRLLLKEDRQNCEKHWSI